jgi:WG containing repeat
MNRTCIALTLVLALVWGTTVLDQNPQSDLYPMVKNDKLGFIDRSGREVIPAQFSTAADATVFREGIANVGATAGWTYIDGSGKFIISVGSKWGYLGTDMQMAIPAQFDFAASFSEGMGPVQVGEKWGYIDKSGQIAVRPKYDIAMRF